ncbi:hypothetical protein ABE10_00875, partial [Bacillus toyonensis]|nr:hypothetical protein [Bacillus toyonensis]
GDLHHAERSHGVVVLRQEGHGVGVDDRALRVAHGDRRRIAVAEQVDLVARDVERVVHTDGLRTRLGVRGRDR